MLVVVLILAILAAIALVQLMPKKALAQDSEAKMNAGSLYAHVESCAVETDDYRACEAGDPDLGSVGLPVGTGPGQVTVSAQGPRGFTVAARSRSGTVFRVERGPGASKADRTCAVPSGTTEAGCRDGRW